MGLGDEPEKDVLAVLGLSIEQLTRNNPPLAERWHALLKFAADFDVAAVVAFWNCTDDEARRDLGKLLARSMLRFDPKSERYRLHDLMREAANRRLAATAARPGEPRGLEEAPAS
jgi:hypothetical protein